MRPSSTRQKRCRRRSGEALPRWNGKTLCHRDASLICVLRGRDCRDHRGSEHVRYERDDHDCRVICANDDHGYGHGDRDYVRYDRGYARYDRVRDANDYANDYALNTENGVFLFSIKDYDLSILHGRDAPAILLSSGDVNDENVSNYDDLLHAHRYEESA